jgi:hypothetical protein
MTIILFSFFSGFIFLLITILSFSKLFSSFMKISFISLLELVFSLLNDFNKLLFMFKSWISLIDFFLRSIKLGVAFALFLIDLCKDN